MSCPEFLPCFLNSAFGLCSHIPCHCTPHISAKYISSPDRSCWLRILPHHSLCVLPISLVLYPFVTQWTVGFRKVLTEPWWTTQVYFQRWFHSLEPDDCIRTACGVFGKCIFLGQCPDYWVTHLEWGKVKGTEEWVFLWNTLPRWYCRPRCRKH